MYGTGVNWAGEIVDLASDGGVLEKSGSYYSWKGDRIAQGRESACKWMVENPAVAEEMRALLIDRRKAENAGLNAGLTATTAPGSNGATGVAAA